jgi:hypothetical protein
MKLKKIFFFYKIKNFLNFLKKFYGKSGFGVGTKFLKVEKGGGLVKIDPSSTKPSLS